MTNECFICYMLFVITAIALGTYAVCEKMNQIILILRHILEKQK